MDFEYASDDEATGEVVTQPGGGGPGSAAKGSTFTATAENVAALASFCDAALTCVSHG